VHLNDVKEAVLFIKVVSFFLHTLGGAHPHEAKRPGQYDPGGRHQLEARVGTGLQGHAALLDNLFEGLWPVATRMAGRV